MYRDAMNFDLSAIVSTLPNQPQVLEAGGGSSTRVLIPNARYTTIDNSPKQLARNEYAEERLLGDLQTFDYGTAKFDVAVFWDVLEHLDDPLSALVKTSGTIAPGGVIVVAGPLLRSLKSLVTKFTPHWVHVLYYRHVLQRKNAGSDGYAPFPTRHASQADSSFVRNHLRRDGFVELYYDEYVGEQVGKLRQRLFVAYLLYLGVSRLVQIVTAGRFGGLLTDFVLVVQRPVLDDS